MSTQVSSKYTSKSYHTLYIIILNNVEQQSVRLKQTKTLEFHATDFSSQHVLPLELSNNYIRLTVKYKTSLVDIFQ